MSDVFDIVAPGHAATLQTVIAVWQRVLRHTPVLPDDHFFDLGGDSLLAIQLFAELERVTGRKLPITTIYDASTAAELAILLDEDAEAASGRPAFSPLVVLNEGKVGETTPPVFIVHGIGGNVMELARLGHSIDPDWRVVAIQARGLDGIEAPIDSIEAMADYYLGFVRGVQPQGPYVLVGYSFGGMVALEMSRRLQAAGQSVALLGFVDAYPHPHYWPLVSWLDVRWRRIAHRITSGVKARFGAASRGANALARPFMFDEEWPEAVRRVYDTSLGALARYRPSGYGGSVVFFRAASRSFYLPNSPTRMWRRLLGGLQVVTVPGNHVDMVGRNASELGAEIARHVRAGLARGTDTARS